MAIRMPRGHRSEITPKSRSVGGFYESALRVSRAVLVLHHQRDWFAFLRHAALATAKRRPRRTGCRARFGECQEAREDFSARLPRVVSTTDWRRATQPPPDRPQHEKQLAPDGSTWAVATHGRNRSATVGGQRARCHTR